MLLFYVSPWYISDAESTHSGLLIKKSREKAVLRLVSTASHVSPKNALLKSSWPFLMVAKWLLWLQVTCPLSHKAESKKPARTAIVLFMRKHSYSLAASLIAEKWISSFFSLNIGKLTKEMGEASWECLLWLRWKKVNFLAAQAWPQMTLFMTRTFAHLFLQWRKIS